MCLLSPTCTVLPRAGRGGRQGQPLGVPPARQALPGEFVAAAFDTRKEGNKQGTCSPNQDRRDLRLLGWTTPITDICSPRASWAW
ncbi:hypothetical protein WJX84_005759 [Apatococcus fuscideae]|uniref:Uncharacterized protein n=1 Tax=Apatococcus fuscideae TaxID=2026836 RepID=A0AAW1RMU9_9CHLO